MTEETTALPTGAGATTGSSPNDQTGTDRTLSQTSGSTPAIPMSYENRQPVQDEHESGYRSSGRAVVLAKSTSRQPKLATAVGAGLALLVAGGAVSFLMSGRSRSKGEASSDRRRKDAVVVEEVFINRPAMELYSFWRDFTNLPRFMNNIESVETLDQTRSHWVIKAPAGTSVEFDSRVVSDVRGRLIAWESEPGATVPNRGRVEFSQTPSGSGTTVRATVSYDPPAGVAGRLVAKLFQREPATQAREDLARFKQLMESGGTR